MITLAVSAIMKMRALMAFTPCLYTKESYLHKWNPPEACLTSTGYSSVSCHSLQFQHNCFTLSRPFARSHHSGCPRCLDVFTVTSLSMFNYQDLGRVVRISFGCDYPILEISFMWSLFDIIVIIMHWLFNSNLLHYKNTHCTSPVYLGIDILIPKYA